MIDRIYIIYNINKEADRFLNLSKQLLKIKFPKNKIEFFSYIWKDQITDSIVKKYCKTDSILETLKYKSLNKAEISLFLNHIHCLQQIRNKFSKGNFIIFESDIFFKPNFDKNLNELINSIQNIDWDIINIGRRRNRGGCGGFIGLACSLAWAALLVSDDSALV